MAAVLLTGHGGFDRLVYRDDVPVPRPGPGDLLIRVYAAGVNNTDINTRTGWYSKTAGTAGLDGASEASVQNASWSGAPLHFPRIQGADCCGRIVEVGPAVDRARLGERMIVRNLLRSYVDFRPFECWTLGSECDGAFAQYVKAPARETYRVDCNWTDAELAAVPCAYSTAEGMLHRASVRAGEQVLVTGASGGVGSAAVQLARRRGAKVIATAGDAKAEGVRQLGADLVLPRGTDLHKALGADAADVVVDVVAGSMIPQLLGILKRGGRYAIAGAIAGPMAQLDMRTIYLRDLSLLGCTFQDDSVFENLVGYIERNEFRPVVAQTYPLSAIVKAQQDFLAKGFVGKLILVPPQE